jgi:hypothetical protein
LPPLREAFGESGGVTGVFSPPVLGGGVDEPELALASLSFFDFLAFPGLSLEAPAEAFASGEGVDCTSAWARLSPWFAVADAPVELSAFTDESAAKALNEIAAIALAIRVGILRTDGLLERYGALDANPMPGGALPQESESGIQRLT